MYTTYDYYANEYCGGNPVVIAADFQKILLQAQSIIDQHTFDRCKSLEKLEKNIQECVQNCCCEIVELIYEKNKKTEQSTGVVSEKNKNYSVNYESTDSILQQFEKEQKEVVYRWLSNTNLLYRGI